MKNIKIWFRQRLKEYIIKLLDIHEPIASAVDVHLSNNHPSEIIMIKYCFYRREWEVIADYRSSSDSYSALVREIRGLIRQYNTHPILDLPPTVKFMKDEIYRR